MGERQDRYTSGDRKITIDCFEPSSGGPRPAIVALHGSGGFGQGGSRVRALAQPVAMLGYSVFIPHYFEKTETIRSDASTSQRHFIAWMEAVRHAIDFATAQPNVDPTRVGIIGISLGAFLGLSVASLDSRIRAVVDFFGGFPEPFVSNFTAMPPTLVLHGNADSIVPVSEAYAIERVLTARSIPCEMKIYEGETHFFSPLAGLDAAQRAMGFLGTHLRP